jgi:hypothetical protein
MVLVNTMRNMGYITIKYNVWYFFIIFKIKNIIFSKSENNSESTLQNPIYLKLKNN